MDVVKLLLNLVIKGGLFWIFDYISWVAINPGQEQTTQQALLGGLLMGVIFLLVSYIIYLSYTLLAAGCLPLLFALPVVFALSGYLVLRLIAHYAPIFLALPHGFWLTAFVGLLATFVGIPHVQLQRKNEPPARVVLYRSNF